MGQYHFTVNLDKKQFINPHKLGDGLKLLEQVGRSPGGTNDALHLLLAVSNGRGGGDAQSDSPLIGSWGGNCIAVVGDYAKDRDLPAKFKASKIYGECDEDGEYKDITDELIPVMEREFEVVYCGDGWKDRFNLSESIEGWEGSHGYGDRTAMIAGGSYKMSEVLSAFKAWAKRNPDAFRNETKVKVADLGLQPIEK
jgi:hypothetical protein